MFRTQVIDVEGLAEYFVLTILLAWFLQWRLPDHFTQSILHVGILVEPVDLHPNYAMTLFQRTFNTTLMKYVTQYRLSHAQRLLVTTTDSIAHIAFSSGFGSLSRFNEIFRLS